MADPPHLDEDLAEPATDDESFLDDVFERALACAERGEAPHVDEWLAGREHLRERALETLQTALEVVAHPLARPLGPRIAGYAIERLLGAGAMGSVHLARQTALGDRRVALKVLPPASALSARARARFLAEARALARVRHPHVVAVHDVVDAEGVVAYAMEWVDGRSLAQLLGAARGVDRSRRLEAVAGELGCSAEALGATWTLFCCRVAIAIARALDAVHAAGLLHRDVKPSNILVRRDGTPLLSDFGLVRDEDSSFHTRTGHYLGTPAYSSPEQLRGEHERVDARSDVYSLGATLYEALALVPPYAAVAPAAILAKAEAGSFTPLRKREPALARDIETIVAKCLDPDPARRYASAGELADDLERLVRLQPILARPASLGTRAGKWARRNRVALVSSLGVAAVVTVAAVALARWAIDRSRADACALEKLAEAQQALLDPVYANRAFYAAHPHIPDVTEDDPTRRYELTDHAASALPLYAAALDFVPSREVRERIELERDVVAFALAVSRGVDSASPRLLVDCPVTVSWGATRLRKSAPSTDPISPSTFVSALDRRHLGLLAFLLGDAKRSIEAWREFSLTKPSEPLADASLGILYLALDEPAHAAPRLARACDAYPDAGFLQVELADAIVRMAVASARLEDLVTAEQLLDRAEPLSLHDPFETALRIRADIAAARGHLDEALNAYERLSTRHASSTLLRNHADVLRRQGDYASALQLLRLRYCGEPRAPGHREEFLEAAEAWWHSARSDTVAALVTDTLQAPYPAFGSLPELLADVRHASGGAIDDASMRQSEKPCTPKCGVPLGHVGRIPLAQIAQLMEVRPMQLSALLSLSKPSKSFLAHTVAFCATAIHSFPTAPFIRPCCKLAFSLILSLLIAMEQPVTAQNTGVFDASLGTLPEAQGWTFYDTGGSPAPVVAGGALQTGPTSVGQYQFWYASFPAIDLVQHLARVEAHIKILQSGWATSCHRAGYTLQVTDGRGTQVDALITDQGFALRNSLCGSTGVISYPTTSGFHLYRLDVVGGSATLFIDNVNQYSIPVSAYQTPSCVGNVAFGDGTNLAGHTAETSWVAYSVHSYTQAYCTAGTTTNGCVPSISGTGTPSASASSGFTIQVANVEGQKTGLIFYGVSGRHSAPWAPGSTSVLCVKSPVQRTPSQSSGGTSGACDGAFSIDWLAYIASHPSALGTPLTAGQVVDAQAWFRDPPAPGTTNLSDALEFSVCP